MAFELLFPEYAPLPETDAPELLEQLTARVAQLLRESPDRLYQLLYRLDIPEHHIAEALSGSQPAAVLAQRILMREVQKAHSRSHSSDTPPGWVEKDLSW